MSLEERYVQNIDYGSSESPGSDKFRFCQVSRKLREIVEKGKVKLIKPLIDRFSPCCCQLQRRRKNT